MANKKASVDTVRTGIEEITTQGDLLYKGATDLERLPKGTSGQTLKMGSSNEPEWTTVASPASPAWSVASSGSFSSATELELSIGTKTTQIILYDINIDANGGQRMYAQISFDGGSTYKSDSTYRYAQRYTIDPGDGSVADSVQLNAGTSSVMRLCIGDMGDASVDASMVRFTVYNPANTSSNKIFETYAVESDSTDSDVAISFGMGMYEGATTAINGIKLYPHDSPTRSMTGNYIVLELN